MNPNCPIEPPPPRDKAPMDGPGPRGGGECYYTSRVLNSTGHYVRFVKKLRALEEEQRLGAETKLKETKNKQFSDFFQRCDRKSLINKVAHRVDLCLASYQDDLELKKKRLKDLLSKEEDLNIQKFMAQVQEGPELIWQDKKERLAYLLAKRKKEHQERYKAIPLDKAVHLHPCLVKWRAKEAQECQLYQMREKQMRKAAVLEMEQMWYELSMRESEALAARIEHDAIERLRRDSASKKYTDYQCEMRRQQRIKEQERLKQEAVMMKAMWDEDNRKADEKELKKKEDRYELGRQKKQMVIDRVEGLKKQAEEARVLSDTWDSLASQSLAADLAAIERRKQIERELDECNRHMKLQKDNIAVVKYNSDPLILEEGQRRQDATDLKRCQVLKATKKPKREISDANQANKDKVILQEKEVQKEKEYNVYQKQTFDQIQELVKHREITDAQARKLYQDDLKEQIAYNKLLKERALKEEMEERKKCELATAEYQRTIEEMFQRPFYSDHVHAFRMQMTKDLRRPSCPCAKPNYCAEHLHIKPPETATKDK